MSWKSTSGPRDYQLHPPAHSNQAKEQLNHHPRQIWFRELGLQFKGQPGDTRDRIGKRAWKHKEKDVVVQPVDLIWGQGYRVETCKVVRARKGQAAGTCSLPRKGTDSKDEGSEVKKRKKYLRACKFGVVIVKIQSNTWVAREETEC